MPVAVLGFLAVCPLAAGSARAAAEPPRSILFLGNSMSKGVHKTLPKMFRESGWRVKTSLRGPNGWTLGRHSEARPTLKRLAQRSWDIVVLQEQSQGLYEERYPAVRELDSLIRSGGGRTVLSMTWRRRIDPLHSYEFLRGEVGGWYGYVPIAAELGATVAPVGWAFRNALIEDPGLELWGDGKHASYVGKYLAALVLYATLTGESPRGVVYKPKRRYPDDTADFLRDIAHRTVFDDPSAADWNLGF